MSIAMQKLGGHAFNHDSGGDAEAEYDRLRDLAHQEAEKRGKCFERSKQAYNSGDGAAAKELSNEGKAHGRKMEEYNKQASEFIFRENNAPGRVDPDTIDLHGQFTEEAEDILEARIRDASARGQGHLHVIVGKGNHSANHVQKIKPRVEQVCQELGLKYHTEENEGRIYVELKPGHGGDSGGGHYEPPPSHHQPPPPHHGGGSGSGGHHSRPPRREEDDLVTKLAKKLGECCVIM